MPATERSQAQDIRWLPVVSLAIATVAAVVGLFAVSAIDADTQYAGTPGLPSAGSDAGSFIGGGAPGDTSTGRISWATTLVDLGKPPLGSPVTREGPPGGFPRAAYGNDG